MRLYRSFGGGLLNVALALTVLPLWMGCSANQTKVPLGFLPDKQPEITLAVARVAPAPDLPFTFRHATGWSYTPGIAKPLLAPAEHLFGEPDGGYALELVVTVAHALTVHVDFDLQHARNVHEIWTPTFAESDSVIVRTHLHRWLEDDPHHTWRVIAKGAERSTVVERSGEFPPLGADLPR